MYHSTLSLGAIKETNKSRARQPNSGLSSETMSTQKKVGHWGCGAGGDRERDRARPCAELRELLLLSDFGFRVSGFEFRVSGFEFRVSGFEFPHGGLQSFHQKSTYPDAINLISDLSFFFFFFFFFFFIALKPSFE